MLLLKASHCGHQRYSSDRPCDFAPDIARGLVARTQGVGRALVHSITAKGVGVLEAGAPVAERVLDDSFKNLSKSERKQLFALVEKVLADDAS
jgi:hypothetical protein